MLNDSYALSWKSHNSVVELICYTFNLMLKFWDEYWIFES